MDKERSCRIPVEVSIGNAWFHIIKQIRYRKNVDADNRYETGAADFFNTT